MRSSRCLALCLAGLLAPAGAEEPQTAPAGGGGSEEGPVLLGRMTAGEVRSHADFSARVERYEPDPGAVELIAALGSDVAIEVVWGSWCEDSEREIPRFFRILDRADEVRRRNGLDPLPVHLDFLAVGRDKTEPAELLEGKEIDLVPTFIVRAGGREVGRVEEKPAGTLEEDLALLILEAAAVP